MSRLNDGFPDRKYYNVAMANNESGYDYTYAKYKDNFNQMILRDPSKYYLCVLRFQIPTADIPILIPEIQSWTPTNPNTNVDLTVYSVTLTWTNPLTTLKYSSGETFVIFVTNVPNSTPRPISPTNPNPMLNPSDYYFIYNYRAFIDMVNTAFATAYNNLVLAAGAIPGFPASTPPFITFNPTTKLMSFHCPPEFLDTPSGTGNIQMFMNYKLFTFFDGVEFIFLDYQSNEGVRIKVLSYNGTNFDGTHYIMAQQFDSLAVWNVFKSIQIVSSFLPVENEIVPVPSSQDKGTYNTISVVKDFVPFYEEGPEFRSFINFRYNGAYELIDMNSNYPITTVDISVYWIDRYGNRYLVSIPYNQVLSIKFAFIKKDTFTG